MKNGSCLQVNNRINFLNTQVDNLTMSEAINRIDELVQEKNNSYVITPNIDHIVMIEKDPLFKEAYDKATLILTDGQPLVWISRLKRRPIKEKISGSDLFPNVCRLAAKKGYSIFILGAAEGVAEQAKKNLCAKHLGLNINGTYSPSFGFENNKEELKFIIELINKHRPDILAIALGAPKGEMFIYQNKNLLNVPVSLSIGASIDFEAGIIKRAPKWMSRCGLEWFYRTIKEPKRLSKRYLKDAIKIIPIIVKYK